MELDLFSGFDTLTLKRPSKPIPTEPPKLICFHPGEDMAQYSSFIDVMNDLAMALKFLPDPAGTGSTWAAALTGSGYNNINSSPAASVWDLITGQAGEGINTADQSVIPDINEYFSSDWDAIKSAGGNETYSQISSGAVSSDENAFDIMCSMLESRQRVFGALTSIFGPAEGLDDDASVIGHIMSFLKKYNMVDPHNMSVLNVFFGMQTDFINAIDAYINCKTYWGGDGSSNMLLSKVDSYISTLSGDRKSAAAGLESMWESEARDSAGNIITDSSNNIVTNLPAWDKVGAAWQKNAALADNSWAKFFRGKMADINNRDAVRAIVCDMFNQSAQRKYKKDKADYEDKKDEKIQEEVWLQKIQAKKLAENKRNMVKRTAKTASIAKATKAKGVKGPSIANRAKPPVAPTNSQVRFVAGMKSSAAAAPHIASLRTSESSNTMAAAQKRNKDSKKVV